MSSTNPPDPNVNTFNNLYWISGDTSLTQDVADKRYLRFPTAQGTENLAAINVNGIAGFNNDIVQTGATNNIVQDQTTNTDQNSLKATQIYGDLSLRKPTSAVGGGLRLYDVVAGVNSSQIYTTGTQMALVNLNNGGSTTITTTDGAGVQTQALQISSTAITANEKLTMNGVLNTDRIISNVYYQLQDANSIGSVLGQIYAGSGVFNYDNDANGGTHNFATNDAGGVQTIPLSFNSVDMTIGTTNPPTCAASSTIVLSDDSNKIPSTAWVRDYVASIPPPIVVQLTYTQSFTGSLSLYNIPIPAGCMKFDIKVIGTGGLSTSTSAQPPSGGEPEYTLQVGGTGGGAGVAYKEGIPIFRQNGSGNYINTLTYINYGAGLSTEVKLNNESICQVFPGGNAGFNFGGAGCTTPPIVNTSWGNWISWNGQAGQGGPIIAYSSPPDIGQVGGGNKYGAVLGSPVISGSSQGSRNGAGSGQLYGALSGPSYGFPSFSASPINYGGVIVTWYIQ